MAENRTPPQDARAERASMLYNQARQHYLKRRYVDALRLFQEVREIAREMGNLTAEADVMANIGACYNDLQRSGEALEIYEAALVQARKANEHALQARILQNMGLTYRQLGRLDDAFRCVDETVALYRVIGNRYEEASSLVLFDYDGAHGRLAGWLGMG